MRRHDVDIEAELITLEAHVDQLLDRQLTAFDRVQAEAIERIGGKLAYAGRTLRMSLAHRHGTLGHAMHQQHRTTR